MRLVEGSNRPKHLIQQGMTGFTLLAFLLTQLALPIPAFALRVEVGLESKSESELKGALLKGSPAAPDQEAVSSPGQTGLEEVLIYPAGQDRDALQERVRQLDAEFGIWQEPSGRQIATDLIDALSRQISDRMRGFKKRDGLFKWIVYTFVNNPFVRDVFFELLRRMKEDPQQVLRKSRRSVSQELADETRKQYFESELVLENVETKVLGRVLDDGLQQEDEVEFMRHLLKRLNQSSDRGDSFLNGLRETVEKIARISQWDFAHRFPGAGGMRLFRGTLVSGPALAADQPIRLKEKFFTSFPILALEFMGLDRRGSVEVARIPMESVRYTSWVLDYRISGFESYEPEVLVSGNGVLEQRFDLNRRQRDFIAWLDLERQYMQKLLELPGLTPDDLSWLRQDGGDRAEAEGFLRAFMEEFAEEQFREVAGNESVVGTAVFPLLKSKVGEALKATPSYFDAWRVISKMIDEASYQRQAKIEQFMRSYSFQRETSAGLEATDRREFLKAAGLGLLGVAVSQRSPDRLLQEHLRADLRARVQRGPGLYLWEIRKPPEGEEAARYFQQLEGYIVQHGIRKVYFPTLDPTEELQTFERRVAQWQPFIEQVRKRGVQVWLTFSASWWANADGQYEALEPQERPSEQLRRELPYDENRFLKDSEYALRYDLEYAIPVHTQFYLKRLRQVVSKPVFRNSFDGIYLHLEPYWTIGWTDRIGEEAVGRYLQRYLKFLEESHQITTEGRVPLMVSSWQGALAKVPEHLYQAGIPKPVLWEGRPLLEAVQKRAEVVNVWIQGVHLEVTSQVLDTLLSDQDRSIPLEVTLELFDGPDSDVARQDPQWPEQLWKIVQKVSQRWHGRPFSITLRGDQPGRTAAPAVPSVDLEAEETAGLEESDQLDKELREATSQLIRDAFSVESVPQQVVDDILRDPFLARSVFEGYRTELQTGTKGREIRLPNDSALVQLAQTIRLRIADIIEKHERDAERRRHTRRVFAHRVAAGSIYALAAAILGVSIVSTWRTSRALRTIRESLQNVKRYEKYRNLIDKIAEDKPYAIPSRDIRQRYEEVTHLVLTKSDDAALAEIERILISSENIDHKKAAIAALLSISEEPLGFLRRISTEHQAGYNDPNFEIRDFTFGALMALDADKYGEEVFDIGLADPLEERRRPVMELLKEEYKPFDDLLVRKGLSHQFQDVRTYALETLRDSGKLTTEEGLRKELFPLLADPSPAVRSQAAFLLASVNAPHTPPSDVKDPLIRVFENDADEQVRLSAAYGIYRYGIEQSAQALELLVEKGLSHSLLEIKATAAKFLALRFSSSASAREIIDRESRSSSAQVRRAIVMGLRHHQDLQSLVPFLKDPDETVRREAALEFSGRVSFDETSIDFVLAEGVGLNDPSPRVAVAVAEVLADGLDNSLKRKGDAGNYAKILEPLPRFFRYRNLVRSLNSIYTFDRGRMFKIFADQVSNDIEQNGRVLDPGQFNILLLALSTRTLPLEIRLAYTEQLAKAVSNSKSEYFRRFGAWSLYHAIRTIGDEDGFSGALQASSPDLIANLRSIVHGDSFDYEKILRCSPSNCTILSLG